MSILSSAALGSTALFYAVLAYYNIFAQARLLELLSIEQNTNGILVMSLRCLGVAYFILSFIIGHMIKLVDKHGPALRTSTITTALFAGVYTHRAFFYSSVTAEGAEACKLFILANGTLLVVSVVALATLPKPADTKRE